MSDVTPILCAWTGEAFSPAGRIWAKRADERFVVGQEYMVEAHEPRSLQSHNHFFAALADAWQNLPEQMAETFASPDHLRRWALIKAGFRDERSIVCASKAEAKRLVAFIKPIDDYAVVVAHEAVVVVLTAKSQSMKAMGKRDFQASKDAVLQIVSDMIGSTTERLNQNAASAA